MVAMATGLGTKYDEMNLWCLIHFCDIFYTGTMNQTVFWREFVKLVWGNEISFELP